MLAGIAVVLAGDLWKRDALCVERTDVEFFVGRGEPTEPAKAVCRSCIVRAECLDYALENGIKHGVWGGLSERERRRLRPVVDVVHTEAA